MAKTVTSKFSFSNVYLMCGFIIAILLLAIYLILHAEIMLRNKFGSTMSAAYIGLMFLILPLAYLYYNQKYFLKIGITDNLIILKTFFWQRPYSITDIKSIDLFARKNIGLLSSRRKSNGISIVTCDQSYFLNDLYYSNTPEIKASIYDTFKSVIVDQTEEAHDVKSISSTSFAFANEKFYDNFLFSADAITFITLYILLFLLYKQESTMLIACISFGLLAMLILLFIFKANYFLLSGNQLIVKNQLLRSKNIVFDFSNIANIVIERGYRQSNTLRINTKNFYSRTFQAGGLWNGTWRRLIQELQTAGIEVKNDTYL